MITLDSLNNLLAELNRNTFFGLKISDILYSLIVFLFKFVKRSLRDSRVIIKIQFFF